MRRLPFFLSSLLTLSSVGIGCSSTPELGRIDGLGSDSTKKVKSGEDTLALGDGGAKGDSESEENEDQIGSFTGLGCADGDAQSNLEPVYLVFLLDQSGSMGDGQNGDPDEKWNPVTQALNAFFEDDASRGLFASLSLFPNDANQTNGSASNNYPISCGAEDYNEPVVAPIPLPNDSDFASAIAAVSPPNEFGTPTYPALAGTVEFAQSLHNEGKKVAIVMVTDGEPYSCQNNTIANTAAEAEAVAEIIPTYVIGVGGQLDNLNAVAQAGGTGDAFLVDLDNPAQTKEDLLAQVQVIRGNEVTCDLPIPAPPAGKTLDITKVNVEISSAGEASALKYNADCKGGSGWHYDDLDSPQSIELCADTCEEVKAQDDGAVNVIFGCETSGDIVR